MPSSRRSRSGKSGAEAPQLAWDRCICRNHQITKTIKQLLLADIDDSDRARALLAELRRFPESFDFRNDLSSLGDKLIRAILNKFHVTNTGKTSTLVKKLKNIVGVSLPSFEGKSVAQLKSLQKEQLIILHLELLRLLPTDVNNTGISKLAKTIVDAKGDGKNYYIELSSDEIRAEVEKNIGPYYKKTRSGKRRTLVTHLQQATGHYEDQSNEWILDEANEIQLQVEFRRLNPNLDNVRSIMTKEELQQAIIELRNQGKKVPPSLAAGDSQSTDGSINDNHNRLGEAESGAVAELKEEVAARLVLNASLRNQLEKPSKGGVEVKEEELTDDEDFTARLKRKRTDQVLEELQTKNAKIQELLTENEQLKDVAVAKNAQIQELTTENVQLKDDVRDKIQENTALKQQLINSSKSSRGRDE